MGLRIEILVLIAFIPLIAFYLFYFRKNNGNLSIIQWLLAYLCSLAFTYTNMTLVVHQVGFYELFFTDIMKGNAGAQQTVTDFLTIYGDKHRHIGHGLLHGAINWICFGIPILLFCSFLSNEIKSELKKHTLIWLLVSMLIGALLAIGV